MSMVYSTFINIVYHNCIIENISKLVHKLQDTMSSIQVQLCDNLPGVCRYVSPTSRPLLLSRMAIHTKSANGRTSSAMAWEFLTNRATFITIAQSNIVIACCALSSVAGVEWSSCFFLHFVVCQWSAHAGDCRRALAPTSGWSCYIPLSGRNSMPDRKCPCCCDMPNIDSLSPSISCSSRG